MGINVTQTQDSGYTVYKFDANNTAYEVLSTDGIEFTVYSRRHAFRRVSPPTVYDSLADMAKRSKALANLAQLIAA